MTRTCRERGRSGSREPDALLRTGSADERRPHALIRLGRIDHVGLRVADLDEAAARWCVQLGLVERGRDGGRAFLACNDEPYCLELVEGGEPGFDHVAFELHREVLARGRARGLWERGVAVEEREGSLWVPTPTGGRSSSCRPAARVPTSTGGRSTPARRRRCTSAAAPARPRELPHGDIAANVSFYTDVLGMKVSDWLGDAGVWLHIDSEHHVMALVETGDAHFHHLAFDVVDIGKMRDLLDHLARHGRWVSWGPTRHGIAGNIATYVRITEEPCHVELYCDMERLADDHVPRVYPDDRYSSNTWGPLPPRSYFRFDAVAVEFERESWETRGRLLPPPEEAA